jgi:hypothetical protein
VRKRKSLKREAAQPQEDFLRPFWYDLPASFYLRVNEAAAELGITRKELVSKAVENFIKESRKEQRRLVLPSTPAQEQLIKDFHRRAGALRWKNISPEEHREISRQAAEARWGPKKTSKKTQRASPTSGRKKPDTFNKS